MTICSHNINNDPETNMQIVNYNGHMVLNPTTLSTAFYDIALELRDFFCTVHQLAFSNLSLESSLVHNCSQEFKFQFRGASGVVLAPHMSLRDPEGVPWRP